MNQSNLKHKFCIIAIILTVFLSIHIITSRFGIGLNQSSSLSGKVFLIVKGTLPKKRFDRVVFKEVEAMQKITKYPIAHNAKIKEVIGFSGDVVSVKTDRHIYVNRQDFGVVKEYSLKGEKLYPVTEIDKETIIPQDYYFVYTPHKDSYDSRYQSIGLVHKSQIIGRAYEIL